MPCPTKKANQLWKFGSPSAYGDRLTQNGVNYTLDLNAGLTQVLNDGTNQYLYGIGRISQVNTTTEYFLTDALGSTRQLTDAQGAVTLANAYDPYGSLAQTAGGAQTSYGFTGELTDPSGMVYLRARYYMPNDGRFLTRDTWGGHPSIPVSFNKWAYVGGNPVNLTDPSGQFPPMWCQFMPSRATYELCVDRHYQIEPISYLELGNSVTGEIGCYQGPTEYRAPGYIEGFGLTLASPSIINWLFVLESVYDFATMEQQYFINNWLPGAGLSDFVWGIVVAEYAGVVYGLKTNSSISQDYPGPVLQYYKGISGGIGIGGDGAGIGVGAGRTRFVSPVDLRIHGETWYLSGSLGVDFLPVADIGAGIVSLAPVIRPPVSYLDTKKRNNVNKQKLYMDIILGRNSVWPMVSNPLNGGIPVDWGARVYGAYLAMKYAIVYEELHQ